MIPTLEQFRIRNKKRMYCTYIKALRQTKIKINKIYLTKIKKDYFNLKKNTSF